MSFQYLPNAKVKRKLTRQNRCFYLRMNSRGRCIRVLGGGFFFCCPRTQSVCSGKRTRPVTMAPPPRLARPSLPRWLQPESVWAQHSQSCSRYWWRRCSQRLPSCCCCCYCRCLCWALNSPHRRFAAAGCLTSCKADLKTAPSCRSEHPDSAVMWLPRRTRS